MGERMNIRDAILKAADHIEQNPRQFNFGSIKIPRKSDCGTPGCALGWIGFFGGLTWKESDYDSEWCVLRASNELLGHDDQMHSSSVFYDKMGALVSGWKDSAPRCAAALRLYADKYHPADQPTVEVGSWKELAAIWKPAVHA
jgi:hypothetical protein